LTAKFLFFAGICLIGFSSAILMDLYFRLRKTGIHTDNWIVWSTWIFIYKVPREYLRCRKEHGWPAWPAYLIWPLLIVGLAFFIKGAISL